MPRPRLPLSFELLVASPATLIRAGWLGVGLASATERRPIRMVDPNRMLRSIARTTASQPGRPVRAAVKSPIKVPGAARLHRAARDKAGGQFSFIYRTTPATARRIQTRNFSSRAEDC